MRWLDAVVDDDAASPPAYCGADSVGTPWTVTSPVRGLWTLAAWDYVVAYAVKATRCTR